VKIKIEQANNKSSMIKPSKEMKTMKSKYYLNAHKNGNGLELAGLDKESIFG